VKATVFDLPNRMGRPRCLAVAGVSAYGRIFRMAVIVEALIFLLNKILDLLMLTVCPDQAYTP
jgi:hypothetical protein